MTFRHVELEDPSLALIEVPGLAREVKVWHLTDSHMTACDERDAEALRDSEKFNQLFLERTPERVGTRSLFDASLARAQEAGVEALALSGDIVHFPSHLGLERIRAGVEGAGVPWLYALGNHDWHFPHLEWGDVTRLDHYSRFEPLPGGSPAAQCVEVGEVSLVALDNSNYQVDPAQVDFLAGCLGRAKVCLLFIHIPLYIPTLEPAVSEKWGAPIMMGAPDWSEAAREKWKTRPDADATRKLIELLLSERADNLAGVFCGHVHFAHADVLREGCVQYVGAPGFEGGDRLVRLVPA